VVLKVKEKSMRMQVDSASQITLDGKKAALTQLKKGHKATVTFKKEGTKFTAEKIVASSNNTASLLPVVLLDDEKALRYTGKIKAVNKTTVSVMKADAKKAFDFEVGSDAVIKVNGKAASLKDLKAGQNVIVTYVKKAGKLHAKTITATSA
jgi:cold shock CspA family protein